MEPNGRISIAQERILDIIIADASEDSEESEIRRKKEMDFLELQRQLIKPLIGENATRNLEDYYESNAPVGGIEEIFSGKNVFEDLFIQREILGKGLSQQMQKYYLKGPKEIKIVDDKSKELFFKFFRDFNPEVLYVAFTCPNYIIEYGEKFNLFVLKKDDVNKEEKDEVIKKANKFLEVLDYSKEFYHRRGKSYHPWNDLIQKIQQLSLQTDPTQDVIFGKMGEVIGWNKSNEYNYGGMIVKGSDSEMRVVLVNAANKKKFGHLKDKFVVYHLAGYNNWGFPYGNLIHVL